MLRDVARRHTDAERNVDGKATGRFLTSRPDSGPLHSFEPPLGVLGLVIEIASYGCSSGEAKDLVIDVTTAVQALVNKSQLYIPGGQTKVNSFWMSGKRLPEN